MIPKVIHYCWFGGNPLPEEYKTYIASWKKYCPDYEIREWNEQNFDVCACNYIQQAYESKKWAFVSDYARFKVLYEYGGVYLDTDVELLKDLTPIVEKGAFLAQERDLYNNVSVNAGLGLAFPKGHPLLKEIIDGYHTRDFIIDGTPDTKYNVVSYVTDIMRAHGFDPTYKGCQQYKDVTVYPPEYFSPMDFYSGQTEITDQTYSIHHYGYTWGSSIEKKNNERLRKMIKIYGRSKGPRIWYLLSLPTFAATYIKDNGVKGFLKQVAKKIGK